MTIKEIHWTNLKNHVSGHGSQNDGELCDRNCKGLNKIFSEIYHWTVEVRQSK